MLTGEDIDTLIKLTLSCILGGFVGYERESRNKSAGLRTNILVCLGSCLIMIMSRFMYQEVEGLTNADPARLAAQVVSGIGFLGAGAIMKEGVNVTGLTTAACLWVVAGVGMAVGAGYYMAAIITTGLVFITLVTLAQLDAYLAIDKHITAKLIIVDKPGAMQEVYDIFAEKSVKVKLTRVASADEGGGPVKLHEMVNPSLIERKTMVELELLNVKNVKHAEIIESLYKLQVVKSVEFV